MENIDLSKIPGREFIEKHLTLDNLDILLERVVQEAPQGQHSQLFQEIATKLGLPIDDILRRVFKIKQAINSWATPLEMFEAGAIGIDAFLKREYPPRPYFLKPILQPGSLVEIYGKTGIGKTFLREAIALALTHEVNIGPWEVEKTAGVLIVDGEMQCQLLQDRLQMLSNRLPERKEELTIISSTHLLLEGYPSLNLTKQGYRDGLRQYLEKYTGIKVVMLDNVVSLFPGLDESASKDWSPSNQWLIELRAMGLAVIKFHHPTKVGNSPRGTALHGDNMDTIIKLQRPKGYHPKQGARFEVHIEKGRVLIGDQADPFIFQIVSDPSIPGKLTWKTEKIGAQKLEEPNANVRNIIIQLHKKVPPSDIAKEVGCSRQYVSTVKKKAIKDKILNNKGSLTDTGRDKYRVDEDEERDALEAEAEEGDEHDK